MFWWLLFSWHFICLWLLDVKFFNRKLSGIWFEIQFVVRRQTNMFCVGELKNNKKKLVKVNKLWNFHILSFISFCFVWNFCSAIIAFVERLSKHLTLFILWKTEKKIKRKKLLWMVTNVQCDYYQKSRVIKRRSSNRQLFKKFLMKLW